MKKAKRGGEKSRGGGSQNKPTGERREQTRKRGERREAENEKKGESGCELHYEMMQVVGKRSTHYPPRLFPGRKNFSDYIKGVRQTRSYVHLFTEYAGGLSVLCNLLFDCAIFKGRGGQLDLETLLYARIGGGGSTLGYKWCMHDSSFMTQEAKRVLGRVAGEDSTQVSTCDEGGRAVWEEGESDFRNRPQGQDEGKYQCIISRKH